MMPKKNRAGTNEVKEIFKTSNSLGSPSFSLRYTKGAGNDTKISFIVPKSVTKLAVKRNQLRRRGYAVLRKLSQGLPSGITGVFIFKRKEENVSVIENEIKNLLNKIN